MFDVHAPLPDLPNALCPQVSPEIFFPEDHTDDRASAKRICGMCDAKTQCLAWALEHKPEGIWGGTSEGQRRRMRQATRTQAPWEDTRDHRINELTHMADSGVSFAEAARRLDTTTDALRRWLHRHGRADLQQRLVPRDANKDSTRNGHGLRAKRSAA